MTSAAGEPGPPGPGSLSPARRSRLRRPVIVLLAVACVVLFYLAFAPYVGPRHQRSNDSVAIADLKTVCSAQAVYQSNNGGYYDTLDCLTAPATCIPGAGPAPLLEPSFLEPLRAGYLRRFHPGARPTLEEVAKAKASLSSLKSYAYVAVPLEPGRTGYRGFCIDDSGALRFTRDGTAPPVVDGRCGATADVVE